MKKITKIIEHKKQTNTSQNQILILTDFKPKNR